MRLKHIDILRGTAAILVTIFHLTGSSGLSKSTASFGKYGFVGVEMFFVISGFILPYSLHKSKYQLKNFFAFCGKRILRIYPPYIASIAISLVVSLFIGTISINWRAVLLHFVFLNSVFGYNDYSAVFWTLKVEVVFYLFIGLTFHHLVTVNNRSVILILFLLGLPFFYIDVFFIFWMPFFTLGILLYNKMFTAMKPTTFWIMVAIALLVNYRLHGAATVIAALAALLFLLYADLKYFPGRLGKILLWFGTISYSLYLVHWEIGRAGVVISRHIPLVGQFETGRVILGIGLAMFCAYFFLPDFGKTIDAFSK